MSIAFSLSVRTAFLVFVLTALMVPRVSLAQTANPDDRDSDGLPDAWETSRDGGMRYGCSPQRADMFLVVSLRPGLDRGEVERTTLNEVKRFFRSIPISNPDGSRGVNVIVVWGRNFDEGDNGRPYEEIYDRYMPREWRGYARLLVIGPGSGGQTPPNVPVSATGNDWRTIVHELGHQLGLKHDPPGSQAHSPLYTSLMNYDYNYSFNGDANLVHFSRGKFASLRLNETALSEVLPFPLADLQFLSQSPYNFQLRAAGANTTHVDWNRNGVFGETNVRADINDGYAVTIREEHRLGKCAGAPSLVPGPGNDLIVVYPVGGRPDLAGLRVNRPGEIVARRWDGRSWSDPVRLATDVVDDHHAIYALGYLFLATTVRSDRTARHVLMCFRAKPPYEPQGSPVTFGSYGEMSSPVLVVTRLPEELWLFGWDARSRAIKYRRVNLTGTNPPRIELGPEYQLRTLQPDAPVITQFPFHATYDSSIERIILVTTERVGSTDGRMRIHTLGRMTGGRWVSLHSRLVMGESGFAATFARPWIVHDPSRDRGAYGGYLIYHKGTGDPDPHKPSTTWVVRTIGDRTQWDGWRVNLMGNEWVTTRSAPSAALYGGDIAYAIRWFGGELDNELIVNLKASGIEDRTIIADYDDVSHIQREGLRRLLGRR